MEDDRFRSAATAPIFRKISRDKHKAQLDERFAEVLTERFQGNAGKVDKYGTNRKAKIKGKNKEVEALREIYDIAEKNDAEKQRSEKKKKTNNGVAKSNDLDDRLDYLTKLSRGEISAESSDEDSEEASVSVSSSASSGSDADSDFDDAFQDEVVIDEDVVNTISTGEETRRLALQNCDWEKIKAIDLLMVLQSFCPVGKTVHKVTIYLSDFGKEAIEKESKYGPQGIWKSTAKDDDADDDDAVADDDYDDDDDELIDNGDDLYDQVEYAGHIDHSDGLDSDDENSASIEKEDFVRPEGAAGVILHDELIRRKKEKSKKNDVDIDDIALRLYERQRLKYYFAIAELDSVASALALYEELDGMEFEHSSMTMDLRFVPDDISFHGREEKDKASTNTIPANYKAPDFIINALQHTKVKCSWDEGEAEREKKLTNLSQWRQLNESDFQQYLASSDSDNDEDTTINDSRKKNLRKLLLGDDLDDDDANDKEHDDFFMDGGDDSGDDSGDQKHQLAFVPKDDSGDKEGKTEETVLEAALRKRSEKKKLRKQLRKEKISVSKALVDEDTAHGDIPISEFLDDEEENSNDYDMREILSHESRKDSKKRKSKKGRSGDPAGLDFIVDTQDDRFKEVFQSSTGSFGIDRTSTDFKDTENMRIILKEQQKRRKFETQRNEPPPEMSLDKNDVCSNEKPLQVLNAKQMAEKLKRKAESKRF